MSKTQGLIPERGCLPNLHWRIELSPRADLGGVLEWLRQLGAKDRSPNTFVQIFVLPSEDRVILVPATGRIQLRLSIETDAEERPMLARALANSLFASLKGGAA